MSPRHILLSSAALLAVVALCACGNDTGGGTLRLQALAGPVCPVETVPNDPSCAPQPIAVRVGVVDLEDGSTLTTVTTKTDGPVTVELGRGRYRLVGADPGPPTVAEQVVTVGAEPVAVTLEVDTGIR